MLAIAVALASTANAAALREKDIYLIRELADELAKDLNKQDAKQTDPKKRGKLFSVPPEVKPSVD